MNIREKIRLLPVLILVAMMAFAVRVGEFATGLDAMGAARAQHEVATQPPPMTPATTMGEVVKAAEAPAAEVTVSEISGRLDLDSKEGDVKLKPEFENEAQGKPPGGLPAEPAANSGEKIEWKDAADTDIEYSAVKDELYKDLVQRREALDRKEKAISVREALLSAAERELDQKLRELTSIRSEIEASLKKQSDEELARISSLVKIYESMKPKDAAVIMNTLDLDVMMIIMTRMSERKSSPILAEMNPDRARTITTLLAQQRQLPALAPGN